MQDLHVTISAYTNDIVVSKLNYTICSFRMSWLIHDDFICTIACYGIVLVIFLIVTVNMESYIILLYRSGLGFSDFDHFCWIWFFSFLLSDFAVWVSIRVNISLEVVRCTICCPLQLPLGLELGLELGLASFTGNPHICWYGQSNVLLPLTHS